MRVNSINISKQLRRQALNLHYFGSSLSIVRAGLVAALLFYVIFGFFDRMVLPEKYESIYLLRFGYVIPGFIICLTLTYFPRTKRYLQVISFSAVLVGITGMLACMAFAEGNTSAQFTYFIGLMLMFSFSPMLLALNTFFTILAISLGIILFALTINTTACVDGKFFECVIFLEMVAYLFTAGIIGSVLQFVVSKLQRKDKNNILKLTRKKTQFERSSRELQKADEVKNKLLSIISHDIKGPLASIRGILRLNASGVISQEEFSEHSRKLDALLSGTGSLLDNLLYWSIYQGEKVELAIKEVNLYTLVSDNFNLHVFSAATKSIQLINLVNKNISANLDASLINLVLRNLISNAVKFTDNGRIFVTAEQSDEMLSVFVEDTGVGMTQEQVSHMFEWNERSSTSGTREERGTGIGLILCKQFVEKHGGALTIESALGLGTTVIVKLPCAKADSPAAQVVIGPPVTPNRVEAA